METGMCPAGVTLGFGITARLVRDRRAGYGRRTPSGHRLHPLPRQFRGGHRAQ